MIEIVSYAQKAGNGATASRPSAGASRVGWADGAKGICIVLVVMMHATLGVEDILDREGFMHWAVAFSKPFRLPDFFLVSGLFLSRVIDRDWRSYADKRVLHFAYFYVLWLLIQSGVKFHQVSDGTALGFASHLLHSFIEPFSTLWFVYALAIFSVVTKLLRPLSPVLVLGGAALLQVLPIETPWFFLDELCERYVFFLAGYLLAGRIFALAQVAGDRPRLAVAGLVVWAFINGALALTPFHAPKLGATTLAEIPVVGLVAGAAGAVAVIVLASVLARTVVGRAFQFLGSKSLAIYLTFFLPMALVRTTLVKLWPNGDAGVIALIVTISAVLTPLVFERLARGTRLSFLYERPAWARLRPGVAATSAPKETPQPSIDLSRALRRTEQAPPRAA